MNQEDTDRGLHCNTEINYPITPNVVNEILLPLTCVKVDTTGVSRHIDATQRGNRLYDRGERSFTSFNKTVHVDMTFIRF